MPKSSDGHSINRSTFVKRSIYLSETEIVEMLSIERSRDLYRRDRMLNPELVRLLKIPKWEYHTAQYLCELPLKVDHRLVRSVLEMDFELDVKIQFFKWTGETTKMFQHDSFSYMALIRCLEEAKLYSEIHTTIQDVLKNSFVRFSLAELSELMKVLGRAEMVSEALLLYQQKDKNWKFNSSSYNSVILMLMQQGMHEEALEIYADMCEEVDCFPDTVTYSALISTYVKLGRDISAIMLFDEMKDKSLQPTEQIYTTLLGIYSKVGKVKKALNLFEEMKQAGCSPTLDTYTQLIKGLGNAGRVKKACALYNDMLRDGLTPDAVFLINLMNVLRKVGRVEDLTNVFNTPSVVPYNAVIKALFESKAPVSEVTSWFDNMLLAKQIEWTELCCFLRRWMKKVSRLLLPHKRSLKGDKV